jgi:CRISPR/Cas system-associated endoribonuclease Cas2
MTFYSQEPPVNVSSDQLLIDRGNWIWSTPKICVFLFSLLLAPSLFASPLKGEISSKNNERLRQALKEFPEADTNKDGVLTLIEARAFRAQQRGEEESQTRQEVIKPPKAQNPPSNAIVKEGEIKGYHGLYMGHSFFQPSVWKLAKMIPSDIKGHTQYSVFSGGANGSPGGLWAAKKKREQAQKILESKKIDLLVMTYYSPRDSSVEHYSRWFDYAIAQNPAVTFMVALPWDKQPHKVGQSASEMAQKRVVEFNETLIAALREKYPKNRVFFCPYALGAYELIDRLRDQKLPGVKYILDPNRKTRAESKRKKRQLFNDELGHSGELVSALGALLWLQTLYEYDLSKLEDQRVDGLGKIDLRELAQVVSKRIAPFNAKLNKD